LGQELAEVVRQIQFHRAKRLHHVGHGRIKRAIALRPGDVVLERPAPFFLGPVEIVAVEAIHLGGNSGTVWLNCVGHGAGTSGTSWRMESTPACHLPAVLAPRGTDWSSLIRPGQSLIGL